MATSTLRNQAAAVSWRWAALGALCGGLVAMTLWAPAHWLASRLADRTQGQLQLVNARGTIWDGTAGLVLASGAGGADTISLPGQLNWHVRPEWTGLRGLIELPCCAAQALAFRARPVGDGWQLAWQDGQSRWPAAMLAGLGAPWNTLKPEGKLELRTQGFAMQWRGQQLIFQGRLTLDAVDISSSLSTLRPMGSYRVALDGGPDASLLLTTTSGSLQLGGSGRWNGTALRFQGEATAAPGREDALSNLLNIIGRREGARSIITLG